ncbi:WbqC family protein [Rhodocaloribacter litoris]|uniref:WbqC family protein n=1 Tax=Rhodocaloribacter litoris TaxID=2558931 RepID=UPI001424450F|nr:WbqC family protein [Rhodocaloribacter litoris]QXD15529.1 WbqC family protein [Rhodocaloribacter litoris]
MIAVRPPEYFPRLAYFALMDAAERFVLADTFQYSRQSYQNRARLRTPQGRQWVSIPLRGGQHGRPIRAVEIEPRRDWMGKHRRAFMYNYRSTPFFEYYEPDFESLFAGTWTHLADLTCATVALVARLLGIRTPLLRASGLAGAPDTLTKVLAATGADRLLVPEEAAAHDVPLAPSAQVLRYETPPYRQNFSGFEPDVSAVDLLFNYGPEALAVLRQGVALRPG